MADTAFVVSTRVVCYRNGGAVILDWMKHARVLYAIEGLSFCQAAEETGCDVGTCKPWAYNPKMDSYKEP